MFTYLGCDPGSKNYGYTYLAVSEKKVKILSCGMVRTTINNLTDHEVKPPKSQIRKTKPIEYRVPFMEQMDAYCSDWYSSLGKYKPVQVTAERYQSRRMGGATIEHVVLMLGMLATVSYVYGIPTNFITAATWKFQINRLSCLEDMYKMVSLPDHVVDSSFIGLYGALNHLGIPWSDRHVDLLFDELCKLRL